MSRLLLLTCLLGGLALCARARADAGIDVAGALSGRALGRSIELLEDPQRKLSVEDVTRPERAAGFRTNREVVPAFGFTDSAYWLRIRVRNSASVRREWLLELGYPMLDYVTLYVPRPQGGYEQRATGDMLPFSQRDLAYRNFVFLLEEPARGERVYYLRVATGGSLALPLVAWTLDAFMDQQHLAWAGLCVLYGVIFSMSCYHLCLYLFTRQREYLFFACSVFVVGLFQFTFVGHTFQYLLPNQPTLAHRVLPLSIGAGLVFTSLFARTILRKFERVRFDRYGRSLDVVLFGAVLVTVLGLVSPYGFSVRLLSASVLVFGLIGVALSVQLVRSRMPQARLNLIAWSSLVAGVAVAALRSAGMIRTNAFTVWSVEIGASGLFVLISSALASRLNTMRRELADLNIELGHKVAALERAIRHAERANDTAQRAARVKDQFVATMSHELRTPLNVIINLPPGLMEDFPCQHLLVCRACSQAFELEPGERVPADARCPECDRPDGLEPQELAVYAGRPQHTMQYLKKIERSGMHLLQVVNDMLGVDRTRTGLPPLTLAHVDVVALVREVVDDMTLLAEQAGVGLALVTAPAAEELSVDRLRLRQVLINLIGNAIKFSDGRGQVSVSVEARPDCCVFAVADQGIGIAKENQDKIFGSFEQVHAGRDKYGGTGLGLSITRSLVRMHGGEIWVESELGRGATFRLRVPRHPSARLSQSVSAAPPPVAVSA